MPRYCSQALKRPPLPTFRLLPGPPSLLPCPRPCPRSRHPPTHATSSPLRLPRGPNYFEVDVDITSNTVANSVTQLVVGAITSLVVELAPLIEGHAPEELPERLLGTCKFEHLSLKGAAYLDDETGRVYTQQ